MNTVELVNNILATRKTSTDAYERMLPELQAYDPAKVRTFNVDCATVVSRVLGAAPKIVALRTQIALHLPTANVAGMLKLEDYAYALQEAHVRYLCAGKSPDELRALGEEGDTLRTSLKVDATTLVLHGLIDAVEIESCQNQTGYKTIATDLGVLVQVLTSHWTDIRGKCCVTEEELHRAEAIAEALLAFVGVREQSPEVKAAAMDLRDRAFSLLADNYDEAQRAVTYLRWDEGDAQDLAPSLWAGQGGHPRAKQNTDTPADTSTTPPATTTPATTTPDRTPPGATPPATPAQTNVQVGRPNSQPFMH